MNMYMQHDHKNKFHKEKKTVLKDLIMKLLIKRLAFHNTHKLQNTVDYLMNQYVHDLRNKC